MDKLKGSIIILLLSLIEGITTLRLKSFSIPDHAIMGEDIELMCNYDMGGDKLYSVKWYRNGQEFYRYIPSDNPSTAVFRSPGINVDEFRSTEEKIFLRNVNLSTTGLYRCEVSGEAPLFQTASQETILVVVNLPEKGPVITGSAPRYQVGDLLNVSCYSLNSRPAAKLKWYINGEEADPGLLDGEHITMNGNGAGALETSQLDLRMRLNEKHYQRGMAGDLKLKCTATISTIYWKSNEESVQVVRKHTEYSQYKSQVWTSESIINSISGGPPLSSTSFHLLMAALIFILRVY